MPKARTYSRYSRHAVAILGSLIVLYRKERKIRAQDLANRAGISRTTLQKVENGNMGCEIGLVFEVAALVGVRLFDSDTTSLSVMQHRVGDKLALLPSRVRTQKRRLDDDF